MDEEAAEKYDMHVEKSYEKVDEEIVMEEASKEKIDDVDIDDVVENVGDKCVEKEKEKIVIVETESEHYEKNDINKEKGKEKIVEKEEAAKESRRTGNFYQRRNKSIGSKGKFEKAKLTEKEHREVMKDFFC